MCTCGKLYQLKVPEEPKTTYNVGYFNGGTTVNAIAQEASMLFEFRSVSQKCLQDMDLKLREITEDFQELSASIWNCWESVQETEQLI